jgi:hypothetical protein
MIPLADYLATTGRFSLDGAAAMGAIGKSHFGANSEH